MNATQTSTATDTRTDDNKAVGAALLKKCDVAAMMQIGESTLDRLRNAGGFGPKEVRVGGAIRWNRREVEEWLARPTPGGDLMDAKAWRPVWEDLKRRLAK